MELHRGNDWSAAAKLLRDKVMELLADSKCTRRDLRAGVEEIVENIRSRGTLPNNDQPGRRPEVR
jgi:hypothetical protein